MKSSDIVQQAAMRTRTQKQPFYNARDNKTGRFIKASTAACFNPAYNLHQTTQNRGSEIIQPTSVSSTTTTNFYPSNSPGVRMI